MRHLVDMLDLEVLNWLASRFCCASRLRAIDILGILFVFPSQVIVFPPQNKSPAMGCGSCSAATVCEFASFSRGAGSSMSERALVAFLMASSMFN